MVMYLYVMSTSQVSERSCFCVLDVSIWPLFMRFVLIFGTAPKVWHFMISFYSIVILALSVQLLY